MRSNSSNHGSGRFARVAVLAACLPVFLLGVAQQFPPGMMFKNFSVPEYHPAPNVTRMKTLLQGAEAVPQEDGTILIKKLKIETFRVDGEGEFVMLADDCLYDPKQRTARSPGFLDMKTADGRFSTVGMGFLWRENESVLIISNSVHTVIQTGGNIALTP